VQGFGPIGPLASKTETYSECQVDKINCYSYPSVRRLIHPWFGYGAKMFALQYKKSVLRYLWINIKGRLHPRGVAGWGSPLTLKRVTAPRLPGLGWVRVKPLMSGVCGSDLAVLSSTGSRYLSALTSFPFIPGHEVVGEVIEVGTTVSRVNIGDRVVLEPALGCTVRGITNKCHPCLNGNSANCERVTEGDIGVGIQTGYCYDTGGGWGEELVAHESQLHRVPDRLPNHVAVLAEPLSCAIHSVIRASVVTDNQVLVGGCGTLGLLTITALRFLGPTCRIVAVAKYPHQAKLAYDLGADHVVPPGYGSYTELARLTAGAMYPLQFDKPVVVGGVDVSFECVGSLSSLEDVVRWTRARGTVVLVGMPKVSKIDLVPLWYQELRLEGTYAYGMESLSTERKRSFELALDLLDDPERAYLLSNLVSHRFPLRDYRRAISTAIATGITGSVKTVFQFTNGR